VGPTGVYGQPATVQVPVPEGHRAADLEVYYFSESRRHSGWYQGNSVAGWIVPGSRATVTVDGQAYVRFQVNHSGVLQLGAPAKVRVGAGVVDVGATGSRGQWLLATAMLLLLLAPMLRRKRRAFGHAPTR
jgi:hypothetical protein